MWKQPIYDKTVRSSNWQAFVGDVAYYMYFIIKDMSIYFMKIHCNYSIVLKESKHDTKNIPSV